jgi:3-methyl-2-oxobutanoate hydroxymethyltransferase
MKKTKLNGLDYLQHCKHNHTKITALTCYDASFAQVISACGVDILLIGDTLGMVIQGHPTTLPATLPDLCTHTAYAARGNQGAWLMADLPFMTYATPEAAYQHAAQLMQQGAHMVKLEGGAWLAPTVEGLVTRGIPVCGHLGLTPQSVYQLGGYKIQGQRQDQAHHILEDAKRLEQAGASLLVLECLPMALAQTITEHLQIPTIGIGAGPHTDGQILVLYDMLGITPGQQRRFCKNFLAHIHTLTQNPIETAISDYIQAVKTGTFPAPEHCY